MNIYIVRHGATSWNEKDIVQGNIDIELSEKGKSEVEKTAEYLKNLKFNKIFTSELRRTFNTAEIIGKGRNADIVKIKELNELDCGDWEGLTMEQIRNERAEEYAKLKADPEYKIPGGESFMDVVRRFKIGWQKVLKLSEGKDFLFITHIVITRAFLYSNLGVPYESVRSFVINNASFTHFEYDNGRYFLKLWNYRPYENGIY